MSTSGSHSATSPWMGQAFPTALSDVGGFGLPEYAVGLLATHFVELPYDLRLPDEGFRIFLTQEAADAPPIDRDLALMVLGLSPELEVGDRVPVTRLSIARTRVRIQMPLQAADLTFGKWKRSLLPPKVWRTRKRTLRRAVKRGITGPVTVVAATRLVAAQDWPTSREAQDALLDAELDHALEFLNDFLLALGLLTRDHRIRPIARGDLPYLSPVLLDAFPMNEGRRVGATFIRMIHSNIPSFVDPAPHSQQLAEAAARAALLNRRGDDPFSLFYELIHRARASLVEYRPSEAVISAATAVEVLVNITIREAGPRLGISAAKVAGQLEAPFASRFWDVLPKYLGVSAAPPAPLEEWFGGGYRLRHDVVHRGARPSMSDAEQAVEQASDLGFAVRTALTSQHATKDLGELLQWGPLTERLDWEKEEAVPDGEFAVFPPQHPEAVD